MTTRRSLLRVTTPPHVTPRITPSIISQKEGQAHRAASLLRTRVHRLRFENHKITVPYVNTVSNLADFFIH